jgi:hypothetical protein
MAWAKTWGPFGYGESNRKRRVPGAAGLSANKAEKTPCSGAKFSLIGREIPPVPAKIIPDRNPQ